MTSSFSSTPANSVSSVSNIVRRSFVTTISFAALAVIAATFIVPDIHAGPPPVTVTQPVQVQVVNTSSAPAQVKVVGPVEMQGVVQTIDDALRTPFNKSVTPIDPSAKTIYLQFPIPTGKRLVIKAIGLQCSVAAGNFVYAYLTQKSSEIMPGDYFMPLAFQSTIASGFIATYSATISTDIAFDRQEGFTPTIQVIIPTSPGVTPSVVAAVSGYLIDL